MAPCITIGQTQLYLPVFHRVGSATCSLQKAKNINFFPKHSLHSHSMNTRRRKGKFITTQLKRQKKKHTLPHMDFETATERLSTNFTYYQGTCIPVHLRDDQLSQSNKIKRSYRLVRTRKTSFVQNSLHCSYNFLLFQHFC